MSWVIDEFKCKILNGVITNWSNTQKISVDDNGILSVSLANYPCISNWKYTDRRYKNGDVITTFCNLTTHTFYKAIAQDCHPFAYIQSFANATGCGYDAPVPPLPPVTVPFPPVPVTPPVQSPVNPAVPPNIFGALLAYGLYKYMDFCDVDNVHILVNIYRKSYTGAAVEIEQGGKTPVVLTYKLPDENKFSPIRILECKLTFICDANFDLSELYSSDEREFGIEVIKNGSLVFAGYIIPDSCNEPFMSPPYPVTIRATDGLSALKKLTYPLPSGSKVNLRQSFLSILSYCLYKTDTNLGMNTICNLYEIKMLTGLNDDPLVQATVNPLRFTHDNGQLYNIFEVLEAVCVEFGAYIAQINGAWHFVRVNELPQSLVRKRVYNSTGLFIRGENIAPLRNAGLNEECIILEGGEIQIGNAYKRVEVMLKYGNTPSIIFNGDFELWDGDNFNYWSRYGGISISRVQNTIKGTGGTLIPIPNYSCQFNQKYDISKYLQSDPIDVLKGDKLSFSLNIGDTVTLLARFKVRIKIGGYCLFNEVGSTVFTWVNSLAVITLDIANAGGNVANFITSITAPVAPISGEMVVQVFGFSQMAKSSGGRPSRGSSSSGEWAESDIYAPVLIDNFSLKKTTDGDNSVPDSSFNVSSQLGFYTEVPDLIETIFGDYNVIQSLRPSRSATAQSVVKDLYAIYTADKSYSTAWIDYGISNKPLPINLALANTILKAYQKPFRFYSGSIEGDDLSYLDTFNIIVPAQSEFSAKIFTWLNVDFDLKYNKATGMLAEIFTKNIEVTNIVVPVNPGQEPPKIGGIKGQLSMSLGTPPHVQNPNNPTSATSNAGIFTEQFTEPFI